MAILESRRCYLEDLDDRDFFSIAIFSTELSLETGALPEQRNPFVHAYVIRRRRSKRLRDGGGVGAYKSAGVEPVRPEVSKFSLEILELSSERRDCKLFFYSIVILVV